MCLIFASSVSHNPQKVVQRTYDTLSKQATEQRARSIRARRIGYSSFVQRVCTLVWFCCSHVYFSHDVHFSASVSVPSIFALQVVLFPHVTSTTVENSETEHLAVVYRSISTCRR